MKTILKYTLTGLVVMAVCFCWTTWSANTFHSLALERGTTLSVGVFLSFEMVVLTGILVSKLDKQHPSDKDE